MEQHASESDDNPAGFTLQGSATRVKPNDPARSRGLLHKSTNKVIQLIQTKQKPGTMCATSNTGKDDTHGGRLLSVPASEQRKQSDALEQPTQHAGKSKSACYSCGADVATVSVDSTSVLCWGCGATLHEGPAAPSDVHGRPAAAVRPISQVTNMNKASELEKTRAKEYLPMLPIFQKSEEDLLDAVVNVMQFKKWREGVPILQAGYASESFYLVLRGMVEVAVDEQSVLTLEPGCAWGECQLIGLEEKSSVTLNITSDALVGELHRKDFTQILRVFPQERKRFSMLVKKNSRPETLKMGTICKPCSVFESLSDKVMLLIETHLVRRIYFPGHVLVHEGDTTNEMYILARGTLAIDIAERRVRTETCDDDPTVHDGLVKPSTRTAQEELKAAICIGELSLLGLKDSRVATVTAKTVCHVRCLYKDVFVHALSENSEAIRTQDILELMKRKYAHFGDSMSAITGQMLKEVKLFKEAGCRSEFLNFILEHLEPRMFLTGQAIVKQDTDDDKSMYILTAGKAAVYRGDKLIAELGPGAVIGELTVLGVQATRTASVIAQKTCCLQALHRNVLVKALELFATERHSVLMSAFKARDKATAHEIEAMPEAGDGHRSAVIFKLLKKKDLFFAKTCHHHPEFLPELEKISVDRIYMPGDLITEQGQPGESMFIMISGTGSFYVTDHDAAHRKAIQAMQTREGTVGANHTSVTCITDCSVKVRTVTTGSISGELAMLGVTPTRTATFVADTICLLWEIQQDSGISLMSRFIEAEQHFTKLINEHLERDCNARIMSMAVFKNFDTKVKMFLGVHAERVTLFPGRAVVKEGQTGRTCWVINCGLVMLTKNEEQLQSMPVGSVYGLANMLGIYKTYFGTLQVLKTSHVLGISSTTYTQSMANYPAALAAKQLHKIAERTERRDREDLHRLLVRKMIWKRYQDDKCIIKSVCSGDGDDFARDILHAWVSLAKTQGQKRRRRQAHLEASQKQISDWVTGRNDAKAKAKIKRRELNYPESDSDNEGCDEVDVKQQARQLVLSNTAQRFRSVERHVQEWPKPKQSKYYSLKYTRVLKEVAKSATACGVVLPVISQGPSRCAIGAVSGHATAQDVIQGVLT